ncbi:MAG: protein kinase [Granulosicoccus sp.]|nr:protein kinase [Granulosicoccus sp.]
MPARLARRAIACNEPRAGQSVADGDDVKSTESPQVPVLSGGVTRRANGGDRRQADRKEHDGKMTPAPRIKPLDITVPDEIDRYTIGRRIGSGTCGVVHQALDNLLGRDVAVKLSPIGEASVSTGKVPGAQRAYQTEIIAAGRLTHPNIVTVHDAGQYEELNYLVMEVVEGKSLKEYGKGKTLLPVHEALRIVAECCIALDYSHDQGILHRDIKPANIMLAENGAVKLLDFGIAIGLKEDGGLKRQGPTLGTPNYMSPEQILGRELGSASDFYSLATVLFELLTGRQLFKASKVKDLFRTVVHRPAPRLHQLRPDLPIELSNALARALEKKPEARFKTGREMAQALRPFIESFGLVARRPASQQRLISRLQRQPFFLSFSDVEIAQLLDKVQMRSYSRHQKLIAEGDLERRLLIVTDGVVRVQRNGQFVRLLAEGECLGETGFINGTAELHDMVALTDTRVLALSPDALGELPPRVHLHYYRHISELLVTRTSMASAAQIDLWL